MATPRIHACRIGPFTLRYVKGPRFEGDLPWWVVEDLMGSIAALIGREELGETLTRSALDLCPPEDRLALAAIEDGKETVVTAASEFHLASMLAGLRTTDLASLQQFALDFEGVSADATVAVSGDLELACARRGLALDADAYGAANDR